tara:strand:+ start:328 stop:441 length:114 start_codon:yes stop_codon:yes gene_type:complete
MTNEIKNFGQRTLGNGITISLPMGKDAERMREPSQST